MEFQLGYVCHIGRKHWADEVYCILNTIFRMAIKHSVLTANPIDIVFHKKHAHEHGAALTKDEEKFLLAATSGT